MLVSGVLPNNSVIPGGSVIEKPPASAGDLGSISGSERSPGEGNGHPLQRSFLENSTGRAWRGAACGVAEESDTTEATSHAHRVWVVCVQGSYGSGVCTCCHWELEATGPHSTSPSLSVHIDRLVRGLDASIGVHTQQPLRTERGSGALVPRARKLSPARDGTVSRWRSCRAVMGAPM